MAKARTQAADQGGAPREPLPEPLPEELLDRGIALLEGPLNNGIERLMKSRLVTVPASLALAVTFKSLGKVLPRLGLPLPGAWPGAPMSPFAPPAAPAPVAPAAAVSADAAAAVAPAPAAATVAAPGTLQEA